LSPFNYVKLYTGSLRNENLNLLVQIKFLNLFLHNSLQKNWKIYWSKQSFTGLGQEERCSSWGHDKNEIFNRTLLTVYTCFPHGSWLDVKNLQANYKLTRKWHFQRPLFVVVSFIKKFIPQGVRVRVFNTTFNNNSVILVEETGLPRENHWPEASHWQTLSHNVASSTPCHERDSNSQRYWW
jgi:hypothetical protein